MYLLSTLLVCALTVLYWRRVGTFPDSAATRGWLALLAVLILLPAPLLFTGREVERSDSSLFLAVAVDVSLSMETAPDPRLEPRSGTRLQRAQRVLMSVLNRLEASDAAVMAAVTGFTTRSQNLLAWENDFPQVREVVEHVLSSELAAEHGSDLRAALDGAPPLFESLPAGPQSRQDKRILLVVSDGEQTDAPPDVQDSLARLHDLGVLIVALHVGRTAVAEGLRVFDEDGRFVTFDPVGGQLHSVPDPANMRLLAGNSPSEGVFVQVDGGDAAGSVLRFIGASASGIGGGRAFVALTSVLWLVTLVILTGVGGRAR